MYGGGGEREIIYLSLHCHHQNDSRIKMGSDESHFNVSVGSDGQSHRTVSTNLFEQKGEPKRNRHFFIYFFVCCMCFVLCCCCFGRLFMFSLSVNPGSSLLFQSLAP